MKLIIYTDGGSRNNPGPAATGIVIKDVTGATLAAYGEYLGTQTNNYAEYMAIISGLKKARELGATEVECVADSKLVVEQLNGNWKVREPNLQKLFVQAWNEMQKFKKIKISHTLRAGNKEADAEVNKILNANKYENSHLS
jgi:ribonuclease HI